MRQSVVYQAGESVIHRLHPLLKLVWLVMFTVVVFVCQYWFVAYGVIVLTLVGVLLSKVMLRTLRGLRLFLSTAVLLAVLQMAFNQSGETLFIALGHSVTTGGLLTGAYVAGRFMAVILLSYLFILTTDPNELVYALMRTGLPYRYGFMLITALRLVPVFEQEGQIVYNAQLVRGVAYDVRSPRRILTLAQQYTLPLLTSALGKVDSLAVSMEGRCFGKYPQRTWLRTVRFTRRDTLALVISLALCSAIVVFL